MEIDEARYQELLRDAERYRWVRENIHGDSDEWNLFLAIREDWGDYLYADPERKTQRSASEMLDVIVDERRA